MSREGMSMSVCLSLFFFLLITEEEARIFTLQEKKEGLKIQEIKNKKEGSKEHSGQLAMERKIPASSLRKEGRK